jgi:hypothetical protein
MAIDASHVLTIPLFMLNLPRSSKFNGQKKQLVEKSFELLFSPSPIGETASPLFFEGLRHNLGFELLIEVYLAQASVLVFKLFHASHE